MSRHKARPPSNLSLGFVFYILLIHLLGSWCTFEVENILLFASTKWNLCIFVCQVHVLQSLRGDGGWCVTIILKRKNRAKSNLSKFTSDEMGTKIIHRYYKGSKQRHIAVGIHSWILSLWDTKGLTQTTPYTLSLPTSTLFAPPRGGSPTLSANPNQLPSSGSGL